MNAFLPELLTVIIVQTLALISPGPDFAIVFKNSFLYSRRTGVLTAFGVTVGVSVHVLYTLLGIGILIANSIWLLTGVKILGSSYLIYIGCKSLCAKPTALVEDKINKSKEPLSSRTAFYQGFFTNILNPKAMLFFISFFSLVVGPQTHSSLLVLYVAIIFGLTLTWFLIVAICFSNLKIRQAFSKFDHWFERIMGGFLVLLGIKLAFMSLT